MFQFETYNNNFIFDNHSKVEVAGSNPAHGAKTLTKTY